MRLIMTGGGDSEHFEEIDAHFMTLLGDSPSLLFIPLAGKKKKWKNGLERIKDVFSTIKFDNIEMCIDLAELDWDYLKKFDAIYIDGGNTFRLMEAIRNTHTYELLHRFLHHGGVINGDSAGAIVLGSHIETAHFGDVGDENKFDVISYQGLNLIGQWAIHCHYEKDEDEEILEFSEDYGFPVLCLGEETAVYIEDSFLHVIGKSRATVFLNGKKQVIRPGDVFDLKTDYCF